ncbi:hypothetical protein [Granulicella arctica]|uniref:hypothetical protein n=1 Tax=Granulicella arctica TaxID=940613 RepID=UPI0021E0359C|nr:hypothetical protein [Granulicella arctica]
MTHQRPHATCLAIALCLISGMTAFAQSTSPEGTSSSTGYDVTQITGLPDAKPNIKGRLTTTDTKLLFTNLEFKAEIPFARMTHVSIGNERIETGGKTGRIVRMMIPYGGGVAVATITQKSVDLLTIEYLDQKGGYHGAVFVVPMASAKILSARMTSHMSTTTNQLPELCERGPLGSASVVVEPVMARGLELPAEYRALLYEGLIHELGESPSPATYIRAGDDDGGTACSTMKLRITVTGFKKGNQALRASTGPIGFFVGKTSVSFHLELTGTDGQNFLEKDMTNTKRMDSESLGVAESVAKAVAKKIRKLPVNKVTS